MSAEPEYDAARRERLRHEAFALSATARATRDHEAAAVAFLAAIYQYDTYKNTTVLIGMAQLHATLALRTRP